MCLSTKLKTYDCHCESVSMLSLLVAHPFCSAEVSFSSISGACAVRAFIQLGNSQIYLCCLIMSKHLSFPGRDPTLSAICFIAHKLPLNYDYIFIYDMCVSICMYVCVYVIYVYVHKVLVAYVFLAIESVWQKTERRKVFLEE